jgi:hypothetical protein
MQFTTRAIVLAVALCASAPLLAASPGTSTAGTDASMQQTPQADYTLHKLPSKDLHASLEDFLPKPVPQDTAQVNRLGRRGNDEPQDSTSPRRDFSFTAIPAGKSRTWPVQRSF